MALVTTTATTENFLGKCKEKDCDYVIFATGEDVQKAEDFKAVRAGTGVFHVAYKGHFARCTQGHKVFPCKRVKGTYSADHKCDSRCLNARGWSCTCSCGGANHGRGHVATVVQASELPAPVERKHLGEVGKRIRGEVEVTGRRELDRSVLYTFVTTIGGHIIKWFAPTEYDPNWLEGYRLVIRAKVKTHGEFRGVPETVVIYVEEVE
jgi:hypothetical protein